MEGKKYGYLVNGTKSWLIVKSQALADEAHRVFGDEVNITTDDKRYTGAVIGFKEYKHQFCKEQMSVCRGNLKHFPKLQGVNPIQPTLHLQRGQVEIYNIFCAIKSCMRRLCSSNPRSAECITSADYLRARRTASWWAHVAVHIIPSSRRFESRIHSAISCHNFDNSITCVIDRNTEHNDDKKLTINCWPEKKSTVAEGCTPKEQYGNNRCLFNFWPVAAGESSER